MDQIKFVIKEPVVLANATFKSYDVAIYLNDKELPHCVFNAPEVLPLFNVQSAQFDLFTCSCGSAGCAGFQNPVVQTSQDGLVTWTFPKGDDYCTDKKVYVFVEKDFKKNISDLFNTMLKMEKKGEIHNTMISDEGMYYSSKENPMPSYEVMDTLKQSVNWYLNRYQGVENFNNMLTNFYPELVNKKFKYTYNGEQGMYEYNLSDIVCRILNEYPSRKKEEKFLKQCRLAVQAIIDAVSGNKKLLKKLAYKSYEKNDMSSHSLISWDFVLKESDFDFEKMDLIITNPV